MEVVLGGGLEVGWEVVWKVVGRWFGSWAGGCTRMRKDAALDAQPKKLNFLEDPLEDFSFFLKDTQPKKLNFFNFGLVEFF